MKLIRREECHDLKEDTYRITAEDVGKNLEVQATVLDSEAVLGVRLAGVELDGMQVEPPFTIDANALLPVGNRPQGWPQECQEERCSYFVHYLRHSRLGEKDMPHAAYHVAEKQCLEAQERLQELEDQGKGTPSMVNHVLKLEREVRA